MYLYVLALVVFYYVYRWLRELPRVSDKGDKYVYITGCDTGFGNLLARHLDKLGFRVIASCYTEKGEEELRKSCSGNLTTTHLDVRSNESVTKVAAMIKDKVGQRGECAAPLENNQVQILCFCNLSGICTSPKYLHLLEK